MSGYSKDYCKKDSQGHASTGKPPPEVALLLIPLWGPNLKLNSHFLIQSNWKLIFHLILQRFTSSCKNNGKYYFVDHLVFFHQKILRFYIIRSQGTNGPAPVLSPVNFIQSSILAVAVCLCVFGAGAGLIDQTRGQLVWVKSFLGVKAASF